MEFPTHLLISVQILLWYVMHDSKISTMTWLHNTSVTTQQQRTQFSLYVRAWWGILYTKLILCAITADIWIQTHGNPCGIGGTQSGNWAGFSMNTSVLRHCNSINVPIRQTQTLYNHSKRKCYKYRTSMHYKILHTRQVLQSIHRWLFY